MTYKIHHQKIVFTVNLKYNVYNND